MFWLEAFRQALLLRATDGADERTRQDFLQEIELMKTIGTHPNIVSMVGCVTQGEPLCLIVEHMTQGDLLHFLARCRHRMVEVSMCLATNRSSA